jgi:tRNA-2-methylthio-N6-dimethylallyladenosine synthase
MPSFYIKTFGCQMNEHDSEKMAALLRRDGYAESDDPQVADLIVINTCSIREKSYQKAVSEIGRWNGPDKPIVAVTGCVVSHDGENLLKRFPFIDLVLGPDHEAALPQLIREAKEKRRQIALTDFQDISDYEFPAEILWSNAGERRVKAYVTIMKGCDNVCSFCIVPFVRGKEVSRPSADIVDEIRRLEEQGIREVMLLGQNVNSYGKGLGEKTNFSKLLRRIDEKTSIARIRFTSPHPKDLSDELIGEYVRNEKLCPHIHLPVQAGSNRVLKRMRRSYTRETYLRKVEKLRKAAPEIAITTDLIVGFPGETEQDFRETLSLMEAVGFDASYSFAFSPRPNTEAAAFADDVPSEVKKERLRKVQELQARLSLTRNRSHIGRILPVLAEEVSREAPHQLTGRTPQGKTVNFDGDKNLIGVILNCEIMGATPYSLKGVLC